MPLDTSLYSPPVAARTLVCTVILTLYVSSDSLPYSLVRIATLPPHTRPRCHRSSRHSYSLSSFHPSVTLILSYTFIIVIHPHPCLIHSSVTLTQPLITRTHSSSPPTFTIHSFSLILLNFWHTHSLPSPASPSPITPRALLLHVTFLSLLNLYPHLS